MFEVRIARTRCSMNQVDDRIVRVLTHASICRNNDRMNRPKPALANDLRDLSKIELARANLEKSNLSGANLKGADLSYADLTKANLSDTNWTDADLHGATLTEATLHQAVFDRADLGGVDLHNVYAVEAQLDKANVILLTAKRDASFRNRLLAQFDAEGRLQIKSVYMAY